MKEEQRDYWERNFSVTNSVEYYRDHDRWLFPVAIRAVSAHNLSSRHTATSESDVTLYPHLTSRDITDPKEAFA